MNFKFYPLRFEFVARETLFFPPGKAANILRGALGVIFRSIACVPACRECGDARTCEIRHTCPCARIFAPVSDGEGPSGLADPPRPFVFRARHLDGQTIHAGQSFYFDLNVFSLEPDTLAYLVLTFAALAREGLGPRRGRADLRTVRKLVADEVIYSSGGQMMAGLVEPVTLSLMPDAERVSGAPNKIHIDFLTPTELKHDHKIARRLEFSILFSRIRDRIGTLRTLYGEGPLEMDYQASGARAALVRMTSLPDAPAGIGPPQHAHRGGPFHRGLRGRSRIRGRPRGIYAVAGSRALHRGGPPARLGQGPDRHTRNADALSGGALQDRRAVCAKG